jgi:hypothetical protein
LATWSGIDDHFVMLESGVIDGSMSDIMPDLIAELETLCGWTFDMCANITR